MSEENKKKINLSWLKIGSSNISENKEKIEVLEVWEKSIEAEESNMQEPEKKAKSNKISLAWMKEKRSGNTQAEIEKENAAKKQQEAEEQTKAPTKKIIPKQISLSEKKVEVVLETKEEKDTQESKKTPQSTTPEKEKNSDNKDEKTPAKTEEEKDSIFSNYTSDFEKEEGTIIDKLKELWKKPQTRIAFVAFLIITTVVWIGGLFVIDPKRHSISHYKAVLTDFYNQKTGKTPTIQTTKVTPPQTPQVPKITWDEQKIERSGYRITIQTHTNTDWIKIYRFNNSEFDTITKLNSEIDKEITKLKTDKVKNFLLNPWSNTPNSEPNKADTEDKNIKKTPLQLLQERK